MSKFLIFISVIVLSFGFSPISEDINENEIYLENKIVISPNPAVSVTRVMNKSRSNTIERVQVYSIVNQKVIDIRNKNRSSFVELNVFNLNNGKYFVKVQLSDGTEEVTMLMKTN